MTAVVVGYGQTRTSLAACEPRRPRRPSPLARRRGGLFLFFGNDERRGGRPGDPRRRGLLAPGGPRICTRVPGDAWHDFILPQPPPLLLSPEALSFLTDEGGGGSAGAAQASEPRRGLIAKVYS